MCTRYIALHMNVVCVAITRVEGTWCAYCGPVDGWDHDQEWREVLASGDKLPRAVAEVMFPDYASTGLPYSD